MKQATTQTNRQTSKQTNKQSNKQTAYAFDRWGHQESSCSPHRSRGSVLEVIVVCVCVSVTSTSCMSKASIADHISWNNIKPCAYLQFACFNMCLHFCYCMLKYINQLQTHTKT
jgi:hypothetical protein